MLTIRQIQADDLFTVIKIAYATLPERYNPSIFTFLYESFPQGFLVAERYHKIVGFIAGSKYLNAPKSKILMLSVIKAYQRKQIGSQLLHAFVTMLQTLGVSEVELEVKTTNEPALAFYKKHGFNITDHIQNFYQDNGDGYLMKKML
jgi:ribosomal protein S18 acetylase RimI-like enzyme